MHSDELENAALDADLEALASATAACEPPPRVERAFEAALASRARPRRTSRLAWLAAAAAAVLVLAGLPALLRSPPSVPEPVPAGDAGYITLGPGDPLEATEGALVVRVQLTRAGLAALGWAIEAGADAGEAVEADLVLGEDGVVRAIRVVGWGGAS